MGGFRIASWTPWIRPSWRVSWSGLRGSALRGGSVGQDSVDPPFVEGRLVRTPWIRPCGGSVGLTGLRGSALCGGSVGQDLQPLSHIFYLHWQYIFVIMPITSTTNMFLDCVEFWFHSPPPPCLCSALIPPYHKRIYSTCVCPWRCPCVARGWCDGACLPVRGVVDPASVSVLHTRQHKPPRWYVHQNLSPCLYLASSVRWRDNIYELGRIQTLYLVRLGGV